MKSHLPLLLLSTYLKVPASFFILILLPSTIAAHHPISHHVIQRQECDTLFCGGPDIWSSVGSWLYEINQTPLPDALETLDDRKPETLPPVPIPGGHSAVGTEAARESKSDASSARWNRFRSLGRGWGRRGVMLLASTEP